MALPNPPVLFLVCLDMKTGVMRRYKRDRNLYQAGWQHSASECGIAVLTPWEKLPPAERRVPVEAVEIFRKGGI